MKCIFTSSASANKGPWAVLIIFGALLLVMRMVSTPGSAQSQPQQDGTESRNERLIEDTIPKEVPIKVKIKKDKEDSFKDLRNEKWVREFELELTNTGEKPIYFLYLTLITDVKVGGEPLVFPLEYGRTQLGDIISKALPDDIPIKPGETRVFKIHPGQVPAWEKGVRDKTRPEATRIKIKMELLSFGDGTGYFGKHPYPRVPTRQSSLDRRGRQPNKGGRAFVDRANGQRWPQLRKLLTANAPASFLPVNFLSSTSLEAVSILADGCPIAECFGVIPHAPVSVC